MSDEIKSTMEKVMERLAAMDAAGGGGVVDRSEEDLQEGMRRAAGYLRGELAGLGAELAGVPAERQANLLRGMARTLLRNIFLPRDEDQLAPAEKAMGGLLELAGGGDGDLLRLLGDLKKILEQYLTHRRQLKQQLGEQFTQQMAALEGNLARQTGMAMKLGPEQHPKFQEEWQRIQDELSAQYGRAMEQHKKQLAAMFNADQ